jgi:hypothetical protein
MDEPDRVPLGIDPLRLGVHPAITQRDLLEVSQADSLPAGTSVVDRDDYVRSELAVLLEPGFELGSGRERHCARRVDRAHGRYRIEPLNAPVMLRYSIEKLDKGERDRVPRGQAIFRTPYASHLVSMRLVD